MKAIESKLIAFLSSNENQFEIPLFQRNYCWKRQHVEQLVEDILEISTKSHDHFLGSFLLFEVSNNKYEIIDGQQRFMTLTLLIKALSSYITTRAEIVQIQNQLKSMILTIDGQVKLKPQSVDEEEFLSIMLKDFAKGNTSYLATAYDVCLDAIEKDEDFLKLYHGLDKLVVVLTILHQYDQNKQTIFEKMNTLGVELSIFDRVRNQLFYKVPQTEDLNYLYSHYWVEIEKNLINQSKDDFVSVYIDSKSEADLNSDNKKYRVFVQLTNLYLEKHHILTPLFKDLLISSKIYKDFRPKNPIKNDKVAFILAQFNQLKITTVYPFVMSILRYFQSIKEETTSLEATLETLLIYVIRSISVDSFFTFSKSSYQIFKLLDKQGFLNPDLSVKLEPKNNHEHLIGYGGRVIRYIYRFLGMPSDSLIKDNLSKVSFNSGVKGRFYIALNKNNFENYVYDGFPKVTFIVDNKNYSERLGNLKEVDENLTEESSFDKKEITASQMINIREEKYAYEVIKRYPIKYNLYKKSQKIVIKITASMDFTKVTLVAFKINRFITLNTSKFSDLYKEILNYMFKRNPMQFVEWADVNKNFTQSGDSAHISYSSEKMNKHHTLRHKDKVIYVNMTLSSNQIIKNSVAILDLNVNNVSLSIKL
jgi:uncharacterized protein with ParB-like and HNH nuclease domain